MAPTVDLRTLLTDLVEIARQVRAGSKVVAIDLKVDGRRTADKSKFTIVLVHDLRFGQVVTNLIENARSFVPETGGRITVRLTAPRWCGAGSRSRTTVPGIRADVIDRVFERFYTDRPDGEDFGQNSGLGLSISRQIIEAHGGTLTAENIPAPQGRSGPQEAQWAGARASS
jgi:two-component system sensor histidine kinase ChvG